MMSVEMLIYINLHTEMLQYLPPVDFSGDHRDVGMAKTCESQSGHTSQESLTEWRAIRKEQDTEYAESLEADKRKVGRAGSCCLHCTCTCSLKHQNGTRTGISLMTEQNH